MSTNIKATAHNEGMSTDINWEEVLRFAVTICLDVGQKLLADFGTATAEQKADGSLVTESDRWADRTIREGIAATFPLHGILSEEGDRFFPFGNWCWVVDPLDATNNFARGIPIWGISLSLLYRGIPVFGYIYLPPMNQAYYGFYFGDTGLNGPTGAFLNGKPIKPSQEFASSTQIFNVCPRSLKKVLPNLPPAKIRLLGMATYNFLLVASGVAIGGVEATPKIWDIAAAWVIIQASGAVWISLENDPIFPLEVGLDYTDRSYPTLTLARPDLLSVFPPDNLFNE